MYVVGHQRVGMEHTVGLPQRFAEPMQVSVLVLLSVKAGLALVASLHDVQRHVVEMSAWAAGHGVRLA
jgi:hypothetical protein